MAKGRTGGNPDLQAHRFKPTVPAWGRMGSLSIRLPPAAIEQWQSLSKEGKHEIRLQLISIILANSSGSPE